MTGVKTKSAENVTRYSLRIDDELLARVKAVAKADRRNMTQVILLCLDIGLPRLAKRAKEGL